MVPDRHGLQSMNWLSVNGSFMNDRRSRSRSRGAIQGCRMTLPVTLWLDFALKAVGASARG